MNVLFLTLLDFSSFDERNIYTDLLREFIKHGHKVYAISPVERRSGKKTHFIEECGGGILKLLIGNIQKTNVIEKGISTVAIEPQFIEAIKRYFKDVKFDLILYSTPPITFCRVVEYVKKRDHASTYLLLKDIFPQNAVDMGMMSKNGLKGVIYRYFRNKEKQLYRISDRIGCMSEANVQYVLEHNPEVVDRNNKALETAGKPVVEVCPNSAEPIDMSISESEKAEIRKQYQIPSDRMVFVYGGNLGKPQGIDFMLKCFHSQRKNDKVFFLIVGNGTEYGKIENYIQKYQPENIRLHQWIPKEDYEKIVAACDVGLIFLDHRFTIPNFPSRLLSYMQRKLPIFAVTDEVTDIGKIIVDNGIGWWCTSDNVNGFDKMINHIEGVNRDLMEDKSYQFFVERYSSEQGYGIILDSYE